MAPEIESRMVVVEAGGKGGWELLLNGDVFSLGR